MGSLNALSPTPEQIKAFLGHPKADAPVSMLNLLRFKKKASYKNAEDISGREAYGRYARAFRELSAPYKAQFTYSGNVNAMLIGDLPQAQAWDAAAIITYPSAAKMFECVSSEAYRAIYKHRMAGLEGQLLISCDDTEIF